MPIVKRKGVQTPNDRAIADAVARARSKRQTTSAEWYERCGELAKEHGIDTSYVLEEFEERAACRQYCNEAVTRDEAERLAFDDVRERFVKQTDLAI